MITAQELREVLSYDPETGVFRWRVRPSIRSMPGSEAGSLKNGYRHIKINGKSYAAHRLAWFYVNGQWPERSLDHINGNPSDNRIKNLRTASAAQNRRNSKAQSRNKSGFKGVSLHKPSGKYRAVIFVEGKQKSLGYFNSPEDAHRAYYWAARRHYRDFARSQ